MSRCSDFTRYEFGDQVTNGTEQGVIVRSDFKSEKTGTHLPRVQITSGSRTGKRVWPWERPRWLPMLDYEPRNAVYRCTECDREYWAPGPRGWCRQCVRKDDAANANRNTGSATFSRVGTAPQYSKELQQQMKAARDAVSSAPAVKRRDDDDPTIPF